MPIRVHITGQLNSIPVSIPCFHTSDHINTFRIAFRYGELGSTSVVRGYCDDFDTKENPSSLFYHPHENLLNVPENLEPITDELDNLFKPFCPNSNIPLPTQTVITSSSSVPQDVEEQEKVESTQQLLFQSNVVLKPRKRKNQQSRVVQHVTADGLLADTWAWRKYGQKPIKGSLYPRSYYRCSSSKGCLARKKVERCFWDPQTFILTYTAEHNHDQPTRRSSLAGTTRNKPCAAKCHAFYEPQVPTGPVLSLTTPHNQFMEHGNIKMEEQMNGDFEGDKIFAQDMMSSDEFLQTLEDLEGILLGQFPI